MLEKLDEVVDAGAVTDGNGHPEDDPVLQQIEKLINGKSGKAPELRDLAARHKE